MTKTWTLQKNDQYCEYNLWWAFQEGGWEEKDKQGPQKTAEAKTKACSWHLIFKWVLQGIINFNETIEVPCQDSFPLVSLYLYCYCTSSCFNFVQIGGQIVIAIGPPGSGIGDPPSWVGTHRNLGFGPQLPEKCLPSYQHEEGCSKKFGKEKLWL